MAASRGGRVLATSCGNTRFSAATCRRPWASSSPKCRGLDTFSEVPLAGWLRIVAFCGPIEDTVFTVTQWKGISRRGPTPQPAVGSS